MPPAELDFQILGPLTVLGADGRALDLGPRKQRAVLALLILDAGRVVSLDRIIAGLWSDEAPSSATGTLQAYISQLRRILEPGRSPRTAPTVLLTREPGYLLAVRPEQVDAVRFTEQVEQGRAALETGAAAAAERLLTAALATWRGEPLAEFSDEAFAAPSVVNLTTQRQDAIEVLIDTKLALGRNAQAAAEARTTLQRDPFRERAWAQLMLALYRDGRQAEALDAYRAARKTLDQELGLPPGPELQALERSILRQDPALAAAPATAQIASVTATRPDEIPSGAPVEAAGMVGRVAQLDFVAERIAAARAGRGGLLLVTGQAGAGKTLLCETAVDQATREGMSVGWGRCVEGSAAPSFWPWIQLLRTLPPGPDGTRLLDVLTGRGPAAPPEEDPDGARFHLHEAVASLLRSVSLAGPMLFVLDDIHLADPSSLRMLSYLAGELSRLPMLVIATMRAEPAELTPALRETLGALVNERGVERVSLQPFTVNDVRQYLSSVSGRSPSDEAVVALHERTGGNPFYLKELLRLLDSEHPGGWDSAEVVAESAVPESVRDVIGRRVARMPEDTQALLRAAAVIGRDVDALLLETTADLDNERVIGLLEPAVATGLLVEVPGGWDYRFAHALVRDALYAELNRLQRARIHRRVGEAMESLRGPDDPAAAPLLAHHFAAAARIGASSNAITYARRAARAAEAALAYDDAVGFLELAVSALDPTAPDAALQRCELLVELGRAQRLTGDVIGARQVLDDAVSLGARLENDSLVIDAATVFGGVTHWNWRTYGQVDEHMVAILTDQLARLDPVDHRRRAALLGTLGVELYYGERRSEGERFAEEAVDLAREYGDLELRIRTLNNYCVAAWVPERTQRRLAAVNEMLSLGPLPRRVELIARMHRMMVLMAQGKLADYDVDLARCKELAAEIRAPELTAQVMYAAGGRAILDGRFGEGERLVSDAFAQQQRTSLWGGDWIRLVLLYTSRRFQGRPAELRDELILNADQPALHLLRPTAVLAACESGDELLARELLDRWGYAVRHDWAWDFVMFQWGLVSSRLGLPDADDLYTALLPVADSFVCTGSGGASWGSNHYVLAGLAHRTGRSADAAEHARAALAAHRQFGIDHLVSASLAQVQELAA